MAEDSASSDHRVVAVAEVEGGYQMRCSCGWATEVEPDPIDVFAPFLAHINTTLD